MKNNQKRNKNTYGILGLGRFGYALAMELAAAGADLLVLDRDEEKVRELREYTENAYVVRNLDKKTLADCGVADCDVAVVCIGSQMDTSILTTLHLVSLGVPHVIAKAASAEQGEILEKLGAEVVYPERDMAIRLAHRMETSRMLDFIQLSEQLNISKLMIPEKAVGTSVLSANLRAKYGVNIIAIETGGKLQVSVDPNYLFQSGDILFVAGDKESLNKLSAWA